MTEATQPAETQAIDPAILQAQAAHVSDQAQHIAADADRLPIKKPEEALAKPAEGPAALDTTQTTAARDPRIVSKDEFAQAEQNLAAYLGTRVNKNLTENLNLSIINQVSDLSHHTNLKFCLMGNNIGPNYSEFEQAVSKAFKEHPAIRQCMQGREADIKEERADDAHGQTMFHMYLPNITSEQYATLIRELAKAPAVTVSAAATPQVAADTAAEVATEAAVLLNNQDNVNAAEAASTEVSEKAQAPVMEMGDASSQHIAEAGAAEKAIDMGAATSQQVAGTEPATKVEAPVMQMGVTAPAQELKRA